MNNNTVKFSIIIPAYNSEKYIDKAIQSVINQTYKNLELIVVNDGSTDRTLTIIESYVNTDQRVKVISKENGGYVSAIRTGIQIADGDYVIFLGSDDYLDLNLLFQLNNVSSYNPDIFVFNTYQFGSRDQYDVFSNIKSFAFINDDSFFEKIKDSINGIGLLCNRDTSKAYRLVYLKKMYYYGKYGVDADDAFTMLFARKYRRYCFLPIIGYYNCIRADSVSAKKPSLNVTIDVLKVWSNYFKNINHESILNMYEIEFLRNSLKTVLIFIRETKVLLKNLNTIKKYRRYCYLWLKKYGSLSRTAKIALRLPLMYSIAHKII